MPKACALTDMQSEWSNAQYDGADEDDVVLIDSDSDATCEDVDEHECEAGSGSRSGSGEDGKRTVRTNDDKRRSADAVDGNDGADEPTSSATGAGVAGKKRGRKPGKKAAEGAEKTCCKKAIAKRAKQDVSESPASPSG